jgi:hypothetical protein
MFLLRKSTSLIDFGLNSEITYRFGEILFGENHFGENLFGEKPIRRKPFRRKNLSFYFV